MTDAIKSLYDYLAKSPSVVYPEDVLEFLSAIKEENDKLIVKFNVEHIMRLNAEAELHKAILGQKMCHADETECIKVSWQDGRHLIIHVMECSECGRTYEHVNGDYEYCPHCGARIMEV